MRLICPNCGAQYAVADDVIPAGGRDVQCSNCAHTWFETPGASASDTPPPPRKPRPATPPPTSAAEPTESRFDGPISKAFEGDIDDDEDVAPAPQPATGRKTVDPNVADILRQEAARETEQRKKETPPSPEPASDMGMAQQQTAAAPAPDAPRPETPAQTAASSIGALVAPASNGNRRELLPDIEEINSSLKPDTARDDMTHAGARAVADKKRRNFRRGFFMMLLVIAILALIYTQAGAIKTAVPALNGLLDGYVSAVDSGRVWIDQNLRSMLTSVSADG